MAETQTLNIYQKLAQIRRMATALQKNKAGFGYRYVSEDEILAKVTAGMNKYGLSLLPGIVPGTMSLQNHTYTKLEYKKGQDGPIEKIIHEFIVNADMTWTWVNDDAPSETVIVPWMLLGQQGDAAQAFGSGLTYTTRYFLLKYFQVATTEDDPDNYRSKQKDAEGEGEAIVASAIIKELDAIVQARLPSMEDKEKKMLLDQIRAVVTVNGKPSANYNAIKDPQMAADALDVAKKYFNIEGDA